MPAIRVENLSKRYRIRHGDGASYRTLRDEIMHSASAPLRWLRGERPASTEDFWALRDVSFNVEPGEVVGVIGRNGAGKSTLLKILSRITKPTSGRVTMRGRVGSLLEVGTGFHPELTGRENIFLSGAILGMKRAEIARKFDEIVAFAEIERFLDTPVKRYSSGMYVRLAFSVAAHLEPDILIIDEVLAVGDAQFQKKCLGRMSEVANEGRTVVFVSHDLRAVASLCSRCVLLTKGVVADFGAVDYIMRTYSDSPVGQRTGACGATFEKGLFPGRKGSQICRYTSIELCRVDGIPARNFGFSEPFLIRFTVHADREIPNVVVGFSFITEQDVELFGSCAQDWENETTLRSGLQTFECEINPNVLTPANYTVRAAIFVPSELYDYIATLIDFTIDTNPFDTKRVPRGHFVGSIYIPYAWRRLEQQLVS